MFSPQSKKLTRTLWLAFALMVTNAGIAAAQSPPLTPATFLAEVLAKGEIYFAEANADLATARARLDRARSNLFPVASLTYEAERYKSTLGSEKDKVDIFGGVEVVQRIYDFGGTYDQINAARAGEDAAKLHYEEARNTVLMEALALFYGLHTSDIRVQALNQDHASAYVRWDRAKERMALGKRSSIDVAEKLALVEKSRLDLHHEQRRNVDLRLRLSDMSGLPFEAEMFNSPKGPNKRPPAIEVEHVQKLVTGNNPQLKRLAKKLDSLKLEAGASQNLPWIEAYGEVNHYSRHTRTRDEWAGGARLKWSFMDGGVKSAERARLNAEVRRTGAELERTRRGLIREARTVLIDRNNAWQQLIAARAQFDFAQKSLLQRQRLYEQDRVADLGRAMRDFTHSEVGVVRAAGNLQLVDARLAVMLGQGLEISLNENFIIDVLGKEAIDDERSIETKKGSGFGQEDQNKINR